MNELRRIKQVFLLKLVLKSLLLITAAVLVIFSWGHIFEWSLGPYMWSIILVHLTVFAMLSFKIVHVNDRSVIQNLENRFPQLQNSLFLLNENLDALNPIEKLQRTRVESTFEALENKAIPVRLIRIIMMNVMGVCLLVATIKYAENRNILMPRKDIGVQIPLEQSQNEQTTAEKLDSLQLIEYLWVQPPAYTMINDYQWDGQQAVAEGSKLTHYFRSTDSVRVKIYHQQKVVADNFDRLLTYQFFLNEPTVFRYEFELDNQKLPKKLKEAQVIPLLKDKAPEIKLKNEEVFYQVYSISDESIQVNLNVTDDYGLNQVKMVSTLSRGQGENVRFREREEVLFRSNRLNEKAFASKLSISFSEIGMQPGDELYVYFVAEDHKCPSANRQKSETYFLQIKDTTSIITAEAGGIAMDIMPEYFRSQRQIIIDTEKLVAEKQLLERNDFRKRSNQIGIDQKILRLRYGQFLGEEFESGITQVPMHDHEHEHVEVDHHDHDDEDDKESAIHPFVEQMEHNHEGDDGESAWMDAFVHAHDGSEIATFFDEAIKAQLKMALAQMWEAELHLRLAEPEKAIPYEYQALKLIKEIQQQSRIYVERVGFEPPAIHVKDKRLSGDLSKVNRQNEITYTREAAEDDLIHRLFQQLGDNCSYDSVIFFSAMDKLIADYISSGGIPPGVFSSLENIRNKVKENDSISEENCQQLQGILLHYLRQQNSYEWSKNQLVNSPLSTYFVNELKE